MADDPEDELQLQALLGRWLVPRRWISRRVFGASSVPQPAGDLFAQIVGSPASLVSVAAFTIHFILACVILALLLPLAAFVWITDLLATGICILPASALYLYADFTRGWTYRGTLVVAISHVVVLIYTCFKELAISPVAHVCRAVFCAWVYGFQASHAMLLAKSGHTIDQVLPLLVPSLKRTVVYALLAFLQHWKTPSILTRLALQWHLVVQKFNPPLLSARTRRIDVAFVLESLLKIVLTVAFAGLAGFFSFLYCQIMVILAFAAVYKFLGLRLRTLRPERAHMAALYLFLGGPAVVAFYFILGPATCVLIALKSWERMPAAPIGVKALLENYATLCVSEIVAFGDSVCKNTLDYLFESHSSTTSFLAVFQNFKGLCMWDS